MVSMRPWRDVQKLPRLDDANRMPLTPNEGERKDP
jgi:hypothetical protein